jgi:hypothetical protein
VEEIAHEHEPPRQRVIVPKQARSFSQLCFFVDCPTCQKTNALGTGAVAAALESLHLCDFCDEQFLILWNDE